MKFCCCPCSAKRGDKETGTRGQSDQDPLCFSGGYPTACSFRRGYFQRRRRHQGPWAVRRRLRRVAAFERRAGVSCSLLLCAPLGADRAACLCSGGMGITTKLRALVVDDLQVSDVCWVLTLVVRDVCKQVAAGR